MYADGKLVSRVTNGLIAVDVLLSVLTVPLAALVLFVMTRDKAYSGSFFTIYKVGLFYDIFSLVSTHIIGVIPTRGKWLSEEFMESQLYLKTFYAISYFTHTCQAATNLILSLNRATAVLAPTHHNKIWNHRITLPFCFLCQFGLGIQLAEKSTRLELYLMHYSTGERFPMTLHNSAVRAFWLETFVTAFSSSVAIAVLYCVVVWKFRAKFMNATSTKKEATANRRAFSLLCVSVIVMASELIYSVFYCHSFVTHINFRKDFRIFFVLFFGVTDAYSCLPCYLLLIFYKPIRDDVLAVLRSFLSICLPRSILPEAKTTVNTFSLSAPA